MIKKFPLQKPAFSRVREHILGIIQEFPSYGYYTLPSTRHIAQACGVNRGTVLRVIHSLCEQGLLKTVKKPSTIISHERLPDDASIGVQQVLGPRSMEVYRSLLRDIIDCRFRPGAMLPSFKELRALYGCSAVTIHAAVNSLITTGHAQRFKRGYRVHQHTAVSGRLFLTLVIPEKEPKSGRIPNRIAGFWIDIARECDRLNVDLETYGYFSAGNEPERRAQLRDFVRGIDDRVLGYFIILVDSEPSDILDAITILRATGKPVAAWDVGRRSIMPLPAPLYNDPKILIIGRSLIESSGRIIGRRLIGLGHRNVAVIMTHHWGNDLILEGLRQSFSEAGFAKGLTYAPVIEDSVTQDWRTPRIAEALKALSRDIAAATRAIDPQWKDFFSLEEHVRARMWNHCFSKEVLRQVSQTLSDRPVTCIVGIHWDPRMIKEIRRETALKIPQQLSIVGVLNSEDHIAAGITCCDWNFPAVVNAVVDHFLTPAPMRKSRHRMLEIQSTLLERQSTGPAQRR